MAGGQPARLERGEIGLGLRQRGALARPLPAVAASAACRRAGRSSAASALCAAARSVLDAAQLGARGAELGGRDRRGPAAQLGMLQPRTPAGAARPRRAASAARRAAGPGTAIVSRISPRLPPRFSSRKMSIIRWATSRASCAFSPSDKSLRPLARGDLEHVLLVADHLDLLGQRGRPRAPSAPGWSRRSPIRVERTTFSRVDRAGQRLADALDVVLAGYRRGCRSGRRARRRAGRRAAPRDLVAVGDQRHRRASRAGTPPRPPPAPASGGSTRSTAPRAVLRGRGSRAPLRLEHARG